MTQRKAGRSASTSSPSRAIGGAANQLRDQSSVTVPLFVESVGRLGAVISRLENVLIRNRSTNNGMFGASPEPGGLGGNPSADLPMSDVVRNQLGAIEHLVGLIEDESRRTASNLVGE